MAPRPKSRRAGQKFGLKARLDHQPAGGWPHAVPHRGNPQRPGAAAGFGHLHPSHRTRPIPARRPRRVELLQEGCHPRPLTALDRLPIDPTSATVGSPRRPCLLQPLPPPELVVPGMEASGWAPLGRLRAGLLQAPDRGSGLVSHAWPAPARRPHRPLGEAEALPSDLVLLSRPSPGLWPPPTASRPSVHFDSRSDRPDSLGRAALPGCFVGPVDIPLPLRRRSRPRRSSLPAGLVAFADVYAARPPRAPFGGLLPTRQDSRHGTDCPLVPSLVTRVETPLSRLPGRERPGLTTWPAGGYHGRTCTGWSTNPSPGALHTY